MRWVKRYCTPVDRDQLQAIVHEGRPCPNRAVVVTFDDGYREDLLRVRPVLERFGIRPIVFLPTDYIGTKRRFWWDRIGVCVATTTRRSIRLDNSEPAEHPLDTPADRDTVVARLLTQAKPLPAAERDEMISQLERDLDVGDTSVASRPRVVSWDEVRELRSTYDFDAHTRSHPVLSTLSASEARDELVGAKAVIEEELGASCQTMAIPYGGASDYSEETLRIAEAAGYAMVFTLEETVRPIMRRGQMAVVDRVALSAEGGPAGMALKVTWPRIFIPDWTGQIMQQVEHVRRWTERTLPIGSPE
jgi:peptidoglycan/xylan/chitin deacetylase (PgdA/CDA1 family)